VRRFLSLIARDALSGARANQSGSLSRMAWNRTKTAILRDSSGKRLDRAGGSNETDFILIAGHSVYNVIADSCRLVDRCPRRKTSMPFIPVPSTAMATLTYEYASGSVAQNRLFCATSDPPVFSDLEEIGDALYDVVVAQLIPIMSSWAQLDGIRVRAMNEEEGLLFEDTNAYPVPGTLVSSAPTGAQVTATTTLNTGLVGRSARGRVYLVGIPPGGFTDNRLTDVYQGQLQTAWNAIVSAMETAGHALQVVSFFDGGVARTEGRPLPVLSATARFPLATQRRRLS